MAVLYEYLYLIYTFRLKLALFFLTEYETGVTIVFDYVKVDFFYIILSLYPVRLSDGTLELINADILYFAFI